MGQTFLSTREREDVKIDLKINLILVREIDACLYKSRRGLLLMTMDAINGGTAQQKKKLKKDLPLSHSPDLPASRQVQASFPQ